MFSLNQECEKLTRWGNYKKALEGKDVKDLLLNVGSGGGAAAAPAAGGAEAAPAAEEAKEEKKAEGTFFTHKIRFAKGHGFL